MTLTYPTLAQQAADTLLREIERHGLETLKHYPSDFKKDLEALIERAEAGTQFAWKIGHCGPHLFQLGLHQSQNECVTYVTRDSASDRFYLLSFHQGRFELVEKSAAQFEELRHTRIPYQMDGGPRGFWLTKNGIRLGSCTNEFIGDHQQTRYRTTLALARGLSKTDKAALQLHANYACVSLAGTLFFQQEVVEKPLEPTCKLCDDSGQVSPMQRCICTY